MKSVHGEQLCEKVRPRAHPYISMDSGLLKASLLEYGSIADKLRLCQVSYGYARSAPAIPYQLRLYQISYGYTRSATAIPDRLRLYKISYGYTRSAMAIPDQLRLQHISIGYTRSATTLPDELRLNQIGTSCLRPITEVKHLWAALTNGWVTRLSNIMKSCS